VSSLVVAVEQVVFGKSRREDPLTPLSGLVGIEAPPGISKRATLMVEEANGDTAGEHTRTEVGTDLEASGGHRFDSFAGKKGGRRVQGQGTCERSKSLRPVIVRGWEYRPRRRSAASQTSEVAGGPGEGAIVEAPCEFDKIATRCAASEAAPDVSFSVDDKGVWVVALMQRARSDQAGSSPAQAVKQALVAKDLLYADRVLEELEVEMRGDHEPFPLLAYRGERC
jgi:hypothetical protein